MAMTTEIRPDDLDALFAGLRADAPVPSDALMARVLADALAEQPRAAAAPPAPAFLTVPPTMARAAHPPRLWARIVAALGGAVAVAGVGSAALAGLMVGFVQPAALNGLTDAVWGATYETVELMPSVDALMTEE
jgi:hypothetical protein